MGKATSLSLKEYLIGASLRQATSLLSNITLGCKSLPRTNTLAYHKHSQITVVKSFVTFGPDGDHSVLGEDDRLSSMTWNSKLCKNDAYNGTGHFFGQLGFSSNSVTSVTSGRLYCDSLVAKPLEQTVL